MDDWSWSAAKYSSQKFTTCIGVIPRAWPPTFQGRTKNIFVIKYKHKDNELVAPPLWSTFSRLWLLDIIFSYPLKSWSRTRVQNMHAAPIFQLADIMPGPWAQVIFGRGSAAPINLPVMARLTCMYIHTTATWMLACYSSQWWIVLQYQH